MLRKIHEAAQWNSFSLIGIPSSSQTFLTIFHVDLPEQEVLKLTTSPLFTALRDGGILTDDHAGGCVLYEKRELVEALLAKSRS